MNITEIAGHLRSLNLEQELKERINFFHDLCGQPLTGTCWEGLICKSLQKVGVEVDWEPMSHNPEMDMSIKLNEQKINLSLKSSKTNKTRIPISSYRTTSAKTLEEKLELIEKLDSNLHAMFVLSRYHSGKKILPDYYKIYLIDPKFINPKEFIWKEDVGKNGEIKGWHTNSNEKNVNLGIIIAMSSQVWIDIGKDCLEKYPESIIEMTEIEIC